MIAIQIISPIVLALGAAFLVALYYRVKIDEIRKDQTQIADIEADRDAAREEVQRLTVECDKLTDRLDAAVQDRQNLWDVTQEALRGERTSYQMAINAQWQQRGFGAPYPEAPQIPPNAAPQPVQNPIIPRREFPHERQARATRQFAEDMADRLIRKL